MQGSFSLLAVIFSYAHYFSSHSGLAYANRYFKAWKVISYPALDVLSPFSFLFIMIFLRMNKYLRHIELFGSATSDDLCWTVACFIIFLHALTILLLASSTAAAFVIFASCTHII